MTHSASLGWITLLFELLRCGCDIPPLGRRMNRCTLGNSSGYRTSGVEIAVVHLGDLMPIPSYFATSPEGMVRCRTRLQFKLAY